MLRAAYRIGFLCCVVVVVSRAAAQDAPLFVKFGGQVRDADRVFPATSSRGQPLKVLEQNAEAIRVQLKDGSGWVSRSEIGTREEVLQDASQRIASDPENVELRHFRLELLSPTDPEDRTLALADLEHIVRLAPSDPRGYFLRGSLRAKTRQFEAAIEDFTQCLKHDAKWAPALLERGMAYYALGIFDAALDDLNDYLKLEPKSAEGYSARGTARVELQKYTEAEADFAKAIELDNHLSLPWFERARMWMRRHNAKEAVKDLSETLKRDPRHLDATLFLATLLACGPDDSPRDGKRAVELASTACRLASDKDFRPIEALAAAYAEAGDFAKAVEQQERALAVLGKIGAPEGAKNAARYRLSHYKAAKPVRLMR